MDCTECINFQQEFDTNYQGCKEEGNITDEEWEGKVICRYFKPIPNMWED